jgi:hypothetical protein
MHKDGFIVQALLLFAIGLNGLNEQKRADEALKYVQNLALELGIVGVGSCMLHWVCCIF